MPESETFDYSIEGLTVNLHITGRCNYSCKYCFGHYKGIPDLPVNSWIKILNKLKKAKVKKINFTGGEPLVYKGLGDLLNFSNKCGFETSIVTNGVFLSDNWLKENIGNLDIIAISLDSGNETIQKSLNRGNGDHIDQTRSAFKRIRYWANELNHEIYIKINLVVSALNKFDNPSSILLELKPNRVKLLQFCRMKGENDEFADRLFISKKEFQKYVDNICLILEKSGINVVSENEKILWSSYLVLDPQGRFCDKRYGTNKFGPSLVSVSLSKALQTIYSPLDIKILRRKMKDRGGLYAVK